MLVARTCQMYPNAAPSVIVGRFFLLLYNWCAFRTEEDTKAKKLINPTLLIAPRRWPQPVLLRKLDTPSGVAATMNLKTWNPLVSPR